MKNNVKIVHILQRFTILEDTHDCLSHNYIIYMKINIRICELLLQWQRVRGSFRRSFRYLSLSYSLCRAWKVHNYGCYSVWVLLLSS